MNVLIFPLSEIAKKFGLTDRRAMYGWKDRKGNQHPGRLEELKQLGIMFRSKMKKGRKQTYECWCAWEHELELYTQLKAEKGEVLGRAKDYE